MLTEQVKMKKKDNDKINKSVQTSSACGQPPVEYHRPVCTLTNDLKRNHISNINDCVLREHQIRHQ